MYLEQVRSSMPAIALKQNKIRHSRLTYVSARDEADIGDNGLFRVVSRSTLNWSLDGIRITLKSQYQATSVVHDNTSFFLSTNIRQTGCARNSPRRPIPVRSLWCSL